MKTKLMTFAMMMAVMGTISCSKDLYDENKANELKQAEEAAKQAEFIAQYKANFEKRYGQIDPNQSWDFTSYSNVSQGSTRADIGDYIKDTQNQESDQFFNALYLEDNDVIVGLESENTASATVNGNTISGTASVIDWEHYFSCKLTPMYAHYYGLGYHYYHLGFVIDNSTSKPHEMIATIRIVGQGATKHTWYKAKDKVHRTTRDVNTTLAAATGDYWCNYTCDGTDKNPYFGETKLTSGYSAAEITKVREIKIYINGQHVRTYWGFDCDGDKNYSDVICLVQELKYPEPIVKRYLIEDLGDADDFDFNDIVVDCEDDGKGNKTAKIRAMGGTIDFTLDIGGTTWTKSVDGAKLSPVVNVKDMVNTKAGIVNYNDVIATFSIPNWNPDTNNITITVNGTTFDTIYKIQFPHVGEVPMIVAVSPEISWMTERTHVPAEWWLPEETADDAQ
jgi:hypothetical protein